MRATSRAASSAAPGWRALLVTEHAALGGAELSTITAAGALAQRGVRVRLGMARNGPTVAEARRAGVSLLPGAGRFVPGTFRLRMPALMGAARFGPFDLVHVSSLGQRCTWAAEQALAGGRPTVAHLRHPTQLDHAFTLHEAGAFVVTNSDATECELRRRGAERVRFIPNGIDAAEFTSALHGESREGIRTRVRAELGLKPSASLLLAVANIAPYKALDLMLEGLTPALTDDPDLHLVHVGNVVWSSSKQTALQWREQLARSPVRDRVHALGSRSDVARLTAAADVAVVPSRGEGTARAVLEAWATGIPVVASDVDGIVDLVTNGDDGLLVDLTDQASVAAAVRSLLDDVRFARTLARAGRERVLGQFSLRAHVDALVDVHAAALAEHDWPQR